MALPQLSDKGIEVLDLATQIEANQILVRLPRDTDARQVLHFLIGVFADTEEFPTEAFNEDLEEFSYALDEEGIKLDMDEVWDRNDDFEVESYLIEAADVRTGDDLDELRESELYRTTVLNFTQALRQACEKMFNNDPGSSSWDRAAFASAVLA